MVLEAIKETVSNDSCCPDLSLKTRAIGFGICAFIALIFGIMSCMQIGGVFLGHLSTFVIFYSISTVFSILSSFFWKGPKAQWAVITDAKRIIPALIFFVAFVLTLLSVWVFKNNTLVIIFVIIQMSAGLFYMFTFIPGGTALLKRCCCGGEEESTSGGSLL